ncbi:MAG: hypothetical protein N2489_10615 [Clostridia bacterium]|nr:hypothetical protein [Clostridia bacterium]
MNKSLDDVAAIPKPKCQGGHFEYDVTRRHIDACEELHDKSLVISSKFQKMGSCGRIKDRRAKL